MPLQTLKEAFRDPEECLRVLETLLDKSGRGWWLLHRPTGQVKVSRGFRRLVEDDAATPVPLATFDDVLEFVHPEDAPRIREYCHPILASPENGNSGEMEHRLRLANGEYRWIAVEWEVLSRDAAGVAEGVFGLVKRSEDFKRGMIRHLADTDKLASLGALAAGIAHEINNPLAIIAASAAGTRRAMHNGDLEKFIDRLQRLEAACQRIAAVVNSLREYAQKPAEDRRGIFPLSQIVDEATRLCRPHLNKANVTMQVRLAAQGQILCTWLKTQQALINILNFHTTAVQQLPEGDRIVKIDVVDGTGWVEVTLSSPVGDLVDEVRGFLANPLSPHDEAKLSPDWLSLGVSQAILESQGASLQLDTSAAGLAIAIRFQEKSP